MNNPLSGLGLRSPARSCHGRPVSDTHLHGGKSRHHLLVLAGCLVIGAPVHAGTTTNATWDGGGGAATNWNTTANWLNNLQPDGSGTTIIHFAGTTSLTPNNDYGTYTQFNQILFDSGAGAFTLTGSVIKIAANGGTTGKIENNSSVLQTVSFNSNGQSIIFNGSGELDPTAGDLTINNDIYIDNNGTINVYGNNGHTLTLNGAVHDGSAAGSLNIQDNDNVVLTGNNTYTGATTVQAGALQVGNGGTTGTLGTGTVYLGASTTLSSNRTDSPTISNAINLYASSGNTNFSVAAGTSATLSGAITSSGAVFTKVGAGTLFITPNSGSASTTVSNVVSAGVLSVSDFSTSTLGSGGFFLNGGTLQYTGASTSTTRLGNFALQTANSGIAVTTAGTTLTLSSDLGGFGGTVGLVKSSAGTLALSGSNSYTGPTAVSAGTLLVNGSTNAGSAVSVATGATLGGTGTVGGTVALNGTLSPGPTAATGSVGTLTTGALTLASTASALFDVNGTSVYDKVMTAGAVAYAGTLTIDLGAYTPTGTTTYALFSATGESGAFSDDASVAINQPGYRGTFDPTSGTLTITAVPEPATWLGGGLCLGLVGWTMTRRSRRGRAFALAA